MITALGVADKIGLTKNPMIPFVGLSLDDIDKISDLNDVDQLSFSTLSEIIRLSADHMDEPISAVCNRYYSKEKS